MIKTFAQACKIVGTSAKALPDTSSLPKEIAKGITAHAKLLIITAALNDGWKPDWKDTNQPKYYPWFEMGKNKYNKEGFRLSRVLEDYSDSDVGSRLCFRSRELAEHATKTFFKLYKDYFNF